MLLKFCLKTNPICASEIAIFNEGIIKAVSFVIDTQTCGIICIITGSYGNKFVVCEFRSQMSFEIININPIEGKQNFGVDKTEWLDKGKSVSCCGYYFVLLFGGSIPSNFRAGNVLNVYTEFYFPKPRDIC